MAHFPERGEGRGVKLERVCVPCFIAQGSVIVDAELLLRNAQVNLVEEVSGGDIVLDVEGGSQEGLCYHEIAEIVESRCGAVECFGIGGAGATVIGVAESGVVLSETEVRQGAIESDSAEDIWVAITRNLKTVGTCVSIKRSDLYLMDLVWWRVGMNT